MTDEYVEEEYRWVIVGLVAFSLFINSLANNALIPILHHIQVVYRLSSSYVNAPITTSFLVYSLSNIPANYIIDAKGLRTSFLIGTSLYCVGLGLFILINHSYIFVFMGAICISLGQPFVVNCPAKTATFWFIS